MGSAGGSVVRELAVEVLSRVESAFQVQMTLRYDTADPFAVQAVFGNTDGDDVPWVFARELLMVGLDRPAGEGDVRAWPCREGDGDAVRIALTSPDGHAVLELRAGELRSFLDLTFRLCPWGDESRPLDLDGMLEDLLRT